MGALAPEIRASPVITRLSVSYPAQREFPLSAEWTLAPLAVTQLTCLARGSSEAASQESLANRLIPTATSQN